MNVRFVGFPHDTEELISRLKDIGIPPEELVYSVDCNEVKNLDDKLCPYIEIRTTNDKKGKRRAYQIRTLFSEFDSEILFIKFYRGKKGQKSKNRKLST